VLYETGNLTRRHRRGDSTIVALAGVSLSVAAGELVAVVGPSGCGKTTLLQILGLLDAGFEGQLRFEEKDVRALPAGQLAALRLGKIGFVFQSSQFVDALTVLENIALPGWHLHGNRRRAEQRARELVTELDLEQRRDLRPHLLSTGELQRVAVARALSCDPAVVLADEPTATLDAANAARIVTALAGIAKGGRTVIIATHDPVVMGSANRIVSLSYGRLSTGADTEDSRGTNFGDDGL
jgi:ABC-type lipoprotein export system ATPase subunit